MESKKHITFRSLGEENIKEFERLHLGVLPIRYDKSFFFKLANGPKEWVVVAYWRNVRMIGAISCLYEELHHRICITTLVVDAAHRSQGLGTLLVEKVISTSLKHQDHIRKIYLHVHIHNSDAIKFYERLGFQITGQIDNYYVRIPEPHCFVLTKQL